MRIATVLLCLCALMAAALPGAHAASIVGGQGIITKADAATISDWIDEGPLKLTCIFSRTPGDGKMAPSFHNAANGKGRTVVVMDAKLSDGQSYVIGGYSTKSWNSLTGFAGDPTLSCFVFNLSQDTVMRLNEGRANYAIYNSSSYGPTFGGGYDIFTSSNFAGTSYVFGWSYGSGTNLLGGTVKTYFTPGRVDVFTVSAAPEPTSVLAVVCGIVGLGGVVWRRKAA